MKIIILNLAFFVSAFAFGQNSILFFSKIPDVKPAFEMKNNRVQFDRFVFSREIDSTGVSINLESNGKEVRSFEGCGSDINEKESAERYNYAKIYNLFGGDRKQALVFLWDCGKDGTGIINVVDMTGDLKTIFSSEKYGDRGDFRIVDINKDGKCEILDTGSDVFNGADLIEFDSDAVHPLEIFSFDPIEDEYSPANDKFKKTFYGIADVLKLGVKKNDLPSILELCSVYWYMGEFDKGWKIFDRHYTKKNKSIVRSKIKAVLNDDLYIKFLKSKITKKR